MRGQELIKETEPSLINEKPGDLFSTFSARFIP